MNIKKIINLVESDKSFFPWSVERETADFIASLANLVSAKSFLELGTHLGYTSFKIIDAVKNCKVTTVDRMDSCLKFQKMLGKDDAQRFEFIQSEIHEFCSSKRQGYYDVIFIDAEHSFLGVLNDYLDTFRFTRKDTLYIFHDVNNYEVGKFVKFLSKLNFVFMNKLCDLIFLTTPKKPELKQQKAKSGIAVLKLKSKTSRNLIAFFLKFVKYVYL